MASYITAAYWFTASASFANPAITLARAASDTSAGNRPADAPGFIAAQFAGAAAATALFRWLVPALPEDAKAVVVPHGAEARPTGGGKMADRRRVLILCTGNSARSQMAEGLLRELGGGRFEVYSAGTRPTGLRAEAVEAMREVGVDISSQRSKSVGEFAGREFDYVITVCDNAAADCPVFPGKAERIHWGFDDPAAVEGTWDERLSAFRRVRDEISSRLREWGKEVGSRQ